MEDFNQLGGDEKLKAENDFLKMKLMLEHGAQLGGKENKELPPEIENVFLNNVMAFEKQFDEHKTIRLFDKIGRPAHFKTVAEIPDEEMEKAWEELSGHLGEYGIKLDVCSPNISTRELYRFTTEELFEHETDDMNLPGWTTNFIYDEFHPDLVYDNSRMVEQDLFREIFRKDELFSEIHYVKKEIIFNGKLYEDYNAFNEMINRFKSLFDEIELLECNVISCLAGKADCEVKGNYKASAETGVSEMFFEGEFRVELIIDELEYWEFRKIQIDGFNAE